MAQLAELDPAPESVPINALVPIEGTPLVVAGPDGSLSPGTPYWTDGTLAACRALNQRGDGEPSEAVRERGVQARQVQAERFMGQESVYCNAQMGSRLVRAHCTLDASCQQLMKMAIERLGRAARGAGA